MRLRIPATTAAILAAAGLALAWFGDTIFGDRRFFGLDLTAQYQPSRTYLFTAVREGRLPLWNPHLFAGTPYPADPANSLFYPLAAPFAVWPFARAWPVSAALNAMAASLGMFALLRWIGTGRLAALAGGCLYAYGGLHACSAWAVACFNTAVWYPWQVLAFLRFASAPGAATALPLAAAVAVGFLGGSPGAFLLGLWILLFLALDRLAMLWLDRDRAGATRFALWLLPAAAAAAVLAAAQWLPAVEFFGQAVRAPNPAATAAPTGPLPGTALLATVFPWLHYAAGLPRPPDPANPLAAVPYAGLAGVLLVLAAVMSPPHRRLLAPLAPMAVLCAVLTGTGAGGESLAWLTGRLPPPTGAAWPRDFLLPLHFALAFAAALGLDALSGFDRMRARRFLGVGAAYFALSYVAGRAPWQIAAAAACAVACFAMGRWIAWERETRIHDEDLSGEIGDSADLAAEPPTRLWHAVAGAAVLGLLLWDLRVYGRNGRVTAPESALGLPWEMTEAIACVRGDAGWDRVSFPVAGGPARFADYPAERRSDLPAFDERRYPFSSLFDHYSVNQALTHRYFEPSSRDGFVLARMEALYRAMPYAAMLDRLSVRYAVSAVGGGVPGLRATFSNAVAQVQANDDALPRVCAPRRAIVEPDAQRALRRVTAPDFDPRETVVIEDELPDVRWASEDAGAPRAARLVSYEPERVTIEARMAEPGFVVLNDAWYPGWVAEDETGRRLPVRRANYAFRAVWLPAGEHRVTMRFRPASVWLGLAFSSCGWLAVALTSVAALWARTRRNDDA